MRSIEKALSSFLREVKLTDENSVDDLMSITTIAGPEISRGLALGYPVQWNWDGGRNVWVGGVHDRREGAFGGRVASGDRFAHSRTNG